MKSRRWFMLALASAVIGTTAFHLAQSNLEASSAFSAFRGDLLLSGARTVLPSNAVSKLDRSLFATYRVGRNEDLWTICKRFGIDSFSIRSSNGLDLDGVSPGMVLRIPNHKGTWYEVREPESLRTISRGFSRGKVLKEAYEEEVLLANGYPTPSLELADRAFATGTWIFLPGAWRPSGIQLPYTNPRVTSGFGSRRHPVLGITRAHHGLDIAKAYGTPVTVPREGVVLSAGWAGGYGKMIEIRHTVKSRNGTRVLTTRYGHLSAIYVHEGQKVHINQMIGRVGSTGISTGPHLHFEVRDDSGRANNPRKFQ
jgi:murein DD-endopeptidase MepM/ murein hydrolase activator NlpD